jgi:inner membrane protein
MASIGHLAVGLAAGRLFDGKGRSMLLLSVLSLLPDVDVIAFSLKIPYGDPWGHRGASHSLVVAALLAAGAAGLLKRGDAAPWWRPFAFAFVVAASHGLLDSLTDGGRGVALLWPFSTERIFAPYRPIPVAPLGMGLFSRRGVAVALWECAAFLPLFIYATIPERLRPRART